MPQHYTVPTKNAFAALDDDSDADDAILSKPEEVPLTEAPQAAPKAAAARPARGGDDKGRRPRPPQQQGGERQPRRAVRSDEATGDSPNAGGEEGRGVRASRGRSGPRTSTRPVREGQREFDRQSGTGRGREMKKAGGGAHNWGNEGADFGADETAAAGATQNWPATTNTAGEEVPQREGSSVDETPAVPEEPKTLSLDAYRAAIEEKRAALPAAKEAEAAEEDKQKLLQDGYQIYTKEAPLSAQADKRAADEDSSEDNRKPRTMHLAEVAGVNMHYRGRRGGRGGRENGPSNQGQRPQQQQQQQQQQQKSGSNPVKEINLSDQQAFPTLQAH